MGCNTPQRIVKIGGPTCGKGALELRNVFNIMELFLKIEVQGLKNDILKCFGRFVFIDFPSPPSPKKMFAFRKIFCIKMFAFRKIFPSTSNSLPQPCIAMRVMKHILKLLNIVLSRSKTFTVSAVTISQIFLLKSIIFNFMQKCNNHEMS